MSTITDDLKGFFCNTDTLNRLIMANLSVYVVYSVIHTLYYLFAANTIFVDMLGMKLMVPASLSNLSHQPWSLLTYMFFHQDFLHILFNLLWLYWMGRIMLDFLGKQKLFSTYILGGLSGAALYILAYNVFPVFTGSVESSFALGASASIMAIVVAVATLLPDYELRLVIFGSVRLKYFAIIYLLLDFIGISIGNPGGHIAHLGGALWGFIYIKQLQAGNDWAKWFDKLVDSLVKLFKPKSKLRISYSAPPTTKTRPIDDETFNLHKKQREAMVDEILDKISKSGYESLTQKEKEMLFKMSKDEKS